MSIKTKTTATQEEARPARVPKLRFPEFRGAEPWKPVTLQQASTPVTERVGSRKLTPVSISAGVGFVPQAEKFGRDISGNQYQLYTLVKDGDFVYNKGNSLKFPQGCVYQLQGWGQVAAPNVFICFRLKDGYSNVFFQNCFEQNMHGKQIKKHITSGARSNGLLNISKENFFCVEIPTPSPAEQQKIAECLSSVDDLMAAQARKVDALKTHKKGLMQQLFPTDGETQPRLRFPEFQKAGEWEVDELGKVADFLNEKIPLERISLENYVSTENILPDYAGVVKASKLPTTGSVTRYRPSDTLVSNIRPYLKKVWITDKEGGVSNDVIVIRAKQKLHAQYLACLLKNDAFIDYVMTGAKGVKMPRGDIGSIKAYSAHFPSLPEQQRIASCLSSLDALITAETQKLEALKTHKKGLMQQLFPVPDAASA